ncbi:unnamed protein product [Ceutorhynchus assimilis]|uniref:RRM domain-containing protein n=1 Tax=Ceutorhynchus assimilis TaxID=467358 RepID=A0A9N9M9K6_9CUCU|nr:unnamed protein product [Ceutorhynchus assimilis]
MFILFVTLFVKITGYAQEYYGEASQSAYDQGQSVDSGWGQSGRRGTSRGSYRGANRGRGYDGGYGGGEGSGSSGGGIDRSYGGDQRGGFNKGDGSFIQSYTIFVSQMDSSLTEEDIAAHFGSIGVIRIDSKIQLKTLAPAQKRLQKVPRKQLSRLKRLKKEPLWPLFHGTFQAEARKEEKKIDKPQPEKPQP